MPPMARKISQGGVLVVELENAGKLDSGGVQSRMGAGWAPDR